MTAESTTTGLPKMSKVDIAKLTGFVGVVASAVVFMAERIFVNKTEGAVMQHQITETAKLLGDIREESKKHGDLLVLLQARDEALQARDEALQGSIERISAVLDTVVTEIKLLKESR